VDTGVETAKPEEHIYPRDPKLDANLTLWRTLFMSRLIHIYSTEYLSRGIGTLPDIVRQESKKYQETFDAVGKFINDRVRTKNIGRNSDIKAIFRNYKIWHKETNTGRALTQSDLYRELVNKQGEPADKKTFMNFYSFECDADVELFDTEGIIHAVDPNAH
jgi:phage/plasmid-associated DNA primase